MVGDVDTAGVMNIPEDFLLAKAVDMCVEHVSRERTSTGDDDNAGLPDTENGIRPCLVLPLPFVTSSTTTLRDEFNADGLLETLLARKVEPRDSTECDDKLTSCQNLVSILVAACDTLSLSVSSISPVFARDPSESNLVLRHRSAARSKLSVLEDLLDLRLAGSLSMVMANKRLGVTVEVGSDADANQSVVDMRAEAARDLSHVLSGSSLLQMKATSPPKNNSSGVAVKDVDEGPLVICASEEPIIDCATEMPFINSASEGSAPSEALADQLASDQFGESKSAEPPLFSLKKR